MEVVLGIDGVCLDSKNGNVLSQVETGSTNWNSVGTSIAKENLLGGIEKSLKEANVSNEKVIGICLGMSGVDRPSDKLQVTGWIHELLKHLNHKYKTGEETEKEVEGSSILVYNDAVAALASGTMGKLQGAVVISGTGMIVLATQDGFQFHRTGGWGPLLGDQGSGYDVGQQILRAVTNQIDSIGPVTTLYQKVLDYLNLKKGEELIGWAYSDHSWKKFADLAPLASICAKDGDSVADLILLNSAKSLSNNIMGAIKKAGYTENDAFPLVFAGGNLTHEHSLLAKYLADLINKNLPNVTVLYPQTNAAVAAALLIRNKFTQ